MMICTRPTIGWLGYYFLGNSWMRIVMMFTLLLAITVLLLQRSKESKTLQYIRPNRYPPPTIILTPPDHDYLNAFDACAVEAATRTEMSNVIVYVWTSNVSPNDYWTKFIAKMNGVQVSYLDINKALKGTPIHGMFINGGWAGKPSWAVWMAIGGGLLWSVGGVLIPNGVLITKGLTSSAMSEIAGLMVVDGNRISPIAIGSWHHEDLTRSILEKINDFDAQNVQERMSDEDGDFTPLEEILTLSLEEKCDPMATMENPHRHCFGYNFIDGKTDVWNFDFETKVPQSFANRTLLRYTGDNYLMRFEARKILRFFQKYDFQKYCPLVFREVTNLADTL